MISQNISPAKYTGEARTRRACVIAMSSSWARFDEMSPAARRQVNSERLLPYEETRALLSRALLGDFRDELFGAPCLEVGMVLGEAAA